MNKYLNAAPLTLLLAVLAVPALPAEPELDEFQAGDFGRIRYQENGVLIVRNPGGSSPALSETATLNAPIFPGDEIHTAYDQRVEAQLAGGSLIRVDRGSEIVFQALPDPYADNTDNVVLKVASGTIRITAELSGAAEFRVDTPDASIYLLGDGDFRIEVDERGQTRVISRRGVAEVVGDGGSVMLRGGLLTTAHAGSVPDDPEAFNTFVTDSFDRWVVARDDSYRPEPTYVASDDDAEAYREIPTEVRPYYHELRHYGRWVYVPSYGYCWYPYDVPAGWRPYYDGGWSHGPRGYFWVSNEPWGWAPYHYGRWNWLAGYGWCWMPGRVFGGAWVSWSWGSAYLGWAPLNPWNQPVWVRTVRYGYYDPACWTFVRYRDFGHGHGRRPRYSVDDVGDDLGNTAVVTRPPRLSPRELASDPAPRERIENELRRDPVRRIPAIRTDRVPVESFTASERELTRSGRATRAVAGAPNGDRGRTGQRSSDSEIPVRVTRTGEPPTVRERPLPARSSGAPSPRVSRTSGGSDSGDSAVPPRSGNGRTVTTRDSASSATHRSGSTETDTRRRSLYRQVSEPRKTEEPGTAARTTSATDRGSDPRGASSGRSPSSTSRDQRSGPESKSPSSSSSSRDKARSGSESSSSSSSSSSRDKGRSGSESGSSSSSSRDKSRSGSESKSSSSRSKSRTTSDRK